MIDYLSQYSRQPNLEFHKIPYLKHKNTNYYLIKKLVQKLMIQIDGNDISITNRGPVKQNYQSNSQKQEITIPPIIVNVLHKIKK